MADNNLSPSTKIRPWDNGQTISDVEYHSCLQYSHRHNRQRSWPPLLPVERLVWLYQLHPGQFPYRDQRRGLAEASRYRYVLRWLIKFGVMHEGMFFFVKLTFEIERWTYLCSAFRQRTQERSSLRCCRRWMLWSWTSSRPFIPIVIYNRLPLSTYLCSFAFATCKQETLFFVGPTLQSIKWKLPNQSYQFQSTRDDARLTLSSLLIDPILYNRISSLFFAIISPISKPFIVMAVHSFLTYSFLSWQVKLSCRSISFAGRSLQARYTYSIVSCPSMPFQSVHL